MILSGVKIKKQNDTYDTYQVEISMGQLLNIRDALRSAHANPVADEMLKEIDWYLAEIPGPGETKDDMDAAKNGAEVQPGIEDVDIDVELPAPGADADAGAEVAAVDADVDVEAPPAEIDADAELPAPDEEPVGEPV